MTDTSRVERLTRSAREIARELASIDRGVDHLLEAEAAGEHIDPQDVLSPCAVTLGFRLDCVSADIERLRGMQ